ncbi:MAG TPA: glycosyltransferase [Ignavibacteriaceae bacterium]|nr:glycosyltransferase [Ignavibacteriaceae bacterium]
MNKVLFITYYWPPSGKASLHWPLKIIKHLTEFDWQPAVLTAAQDVFSHQDQTLLKEVPDNLDIIKTSSYEPFKLYKRLIGKGEKEVLISSESISRENKSLAHKISVWIRMNLFIPDARAGWYLPAVRQGINYLNINKDFKAIISVGPPHTAHLIGKKLSKKFKIPHFPVFIDPWTDIIYYKNFKRNKAAVSLDRHYEESVLQNSKRVIFVTETMKKDYILKYKWLQNKSEVLYWGYNEEDFNGIESAEPVNEKIILHAGNIFDYQNPLNFWENLKRKIESGVKFKLKFIGTVGPGIKRTIDETGLGSHTNYLGFLLYPEMIKELMNASYLLVCATEPRHVPGKLFEYLRSGKPIIAFGDNNEEVKKILDESNAGNLFNYKDDAEEFFNRAHAYKTNPDYIKQFERKNIASELAEILKG